IGKIDYADFSKDLFGRMFSSHLVTLNKYAGVAKQYMPPKKDPAEKAAERIVPRQRGAGEDIRFPVQGGYPLFWLKRATVSSKSTEQGLSGDVQGEIPDVSTDPAIVRNPTLVRLEGDFPTQKIHGFKF